MILNLFSKIISKYILRNNILVYAKKKKEKI